MTKAIINPNTNNNQQFGPLPLGVDTLNECDVPFWDYPLFYTNNPQTTQENPIVTAHIPNLRSVILTELQDAADYFEMLAQETGEEIDLVMRNEYRSGVASITSLIDENDRFISQDAIGIVQEALDTYLDAVGDVFPLKHIRLETLLQQIHEVEKVYFPPVARAS